METITFDPVFLKISIKDFSEHRLASTVAIKSSHSEEGTIVLSLELIEVVWVESRGDKFNISTEKYPEV